MKRLLLIASLLTLSQLFSQRSDAQVNVNINIGSQPVWGPVGYDYVDYYYLPDIEVYYHVPRAQFIYFSNGNWVFATSLPARHRGFDIHKGYKVVINEPKPYLHFNIHRVRYATYRGNKTQVIILHSEEPKYYVVKGHPRYNGHDNGKHKGWSKKKRH